MGTEYAGRRIFFKEKKKSKRKPEVGLVCVFLIMNSAPVCRITTERCVTPWQCDRFEQKL